MAVELVRSARLAAAPYAHASVAAPGELVFTAGACPLDEHGTVSPRGDVAGQAALALRNLETALAAAGARLADVAKTTVYVVADDRDRLVEAWHEVQKAFGDHDPPSTLLGVARLGYPEQLVEIEAVAVRAPTRT
jgi:enamine deaminase RidA (YjgF/YER057c/UK114 family)